MPFPQFGGNSVNPSQVSYEKLTLTASISLAWPNFQGTGNVVALVMDITANAGGYTITMPDARQAGPGSTALFFNVGAQTINVLDNSGASITSIAAGISKFLYLKDNTTQGGTWGIVQFGAGTSSADAAALAGFGLQAISATLAQAHPVVSTSSVINVTSSDLAKLYVATGGSVAANLPTSASVGTNFFFYLKNNGTGTVTLTPAGADTVDGSATLGLSPGDACMLGSLGGANGWVTVGLGRQVNFAFTQLVKNVAGNVDVTLTSAEAGNKLITLTGLLTGNINVIVPNNASVYYVFNNTSGSFSLTIKTAAGSGIAIVQGTHDVAVCDATNVYRGVTNTAAATAFSAGSAGNPSVTFVGSTDTGMYLPSAHVAGIAAAGFEIMSFNGPAASVNWLDVFAAATGVAPSIVGNGTDVNVGITLKTKGVTSLISLQDGSGNNMGVWGSVASAVNYAQWAASATGVNPSVSAKGTDVNVGLRIIPKGTGRFQFTDGTDTTKVAEFSAAGISTGQTRTITLPDSAITLPIITQPLTFSGPTAARTYTLPDASDTITTIAATQTLTNKTLTTPTVTNPNNTAQTLTDAATVAWDMNSGGVATLTFTAGVGATRALGTPTNLKVGTYILHLIQDATGSRLLTYPAIVKWQSALAPTLSTGANKHDILIFVCDGTNLYGSFLLDVR